jgi:hypothetical protein
MDPTNPRSRTELTTPNHIDTGAPSPRRASTFVVRLLEQLGSSPSVWDPWLFMTPHQAVKRTFTHR